MTNPPNGRIEAELDAADPDIPAELTWEDCEQYLGPLKMKQFEKNRDERGQRIGQAFYNVLSVDDQDRVKDTVADPFYKNSRLWCIEALRFLLESPDPTAKRRVK